MRVGDGAANPYLLTAAILAAGLDGIRGKLAAPEAATGLGVRRPGLARPADDAQPRHSTLSMRMLRSSDILGAKLVDVFALMKRDEVERYEQATPDAATRDVTAWELQEYLADY